MLVVVVVVVVVVAVAFSELKGTVAGIPSHER